MEHNGKKVELINKDYTYTREVYQMEQLMQPNTRNYHRNRTSDLFVNTLKKGKPFCSSYTGLWNPVKFENFDGSKYKKDC